MSIESHLPDRDWRLAVDTLSRNLVTGQVDAISASRQSQGIAVASLRLHVLSNLAELERYLEECHGCLRVAARLVESVTSDPNARALDPVSWEEKPYVATFIASPNPEHTAFRFGKFTLSPAVNLELLESDTGFLHLVNGGQA